jgi:hypothetical protein
MRERLLQLHDPSVPYDDEKWFIVEMPEADEKKFYTQHISFTWFCERELKRAYPDESKIPKGMNYAEYARSIKYCSDMTSFIPGGNSSFLQHAEIDPKNVIRCKGLFDFYEKVGYDRKKKKYIG